MKIIPAIDIIDGKCVRLKKGDYSQKKIYSNNPLEIAKSFEELGISHLHVVDLDGARLKAIQSQKILEKIALNTCLLYTSPSPRDRQKSRMPSSA